ncbi:hypothetical protein ACSHT2_10230 [Bradyrhizobium sp. PUT101]|uniref:hypothetical protein n=1 Tax=Bradyrhizobium sp. PUT101 TaxID=3447427 RepID=UPI003F87CEDB
MMKFNRLDTAVVFIDPQNDVLSENGANWAAVYQLIKKGKIIAYKMEGQTIVDSDSIDAYHMTLPRIEPST